MTFNILHNKCISESTLRKACLEARRSRKQGSDQIPFLYSAALDECLVDCETWERRHARQLPNIIKFFSRLDLRREFI